MPTIGCVQPDPDVSYTVQFAIRLENLPLAARQEVERAFAQLAAALAAIPPGSPFFRSMRSSQLQMEVAGFRIGYRIVEALRELRVVEAQRL